MGATAFLHPYEWVAAGQLLKVRVLAAVPRGWQRNIRIGIGMNNVRLPRLQVAVLRNGMRTAVRAVHAVHNELPGACMRVAHCSCCCLPAFCTAEQAVRMHKHRHH